MFTTIKDFADTFNREREKTLQVLDTLTDESLGQAVADTHRNLGRMAWHIVTSYPEMMKHASLRIVSIAEDASLPGSAATINEGYAAVSQELLAQILGSWSDDTLLEEKDFYGAKWQLGFSLEVLIHHEIHHRAQMTVLMRQAGLKVPGIYGPALEGWATFGAEPPAV